MDNATTPQATGGFMRRMRDPAEKAGGKVPRPAAGFLFPMVVIVARMFPPAPHSTLGRCLLWRGARLDCRGGCDLDRIPA
jgi:hypothetical protein